MEHKHRVRCFEFFRFKLLTCRTFESVQELISEYKMEQRTFIRHIIFILWHMRGGLSREEAWSLSPFERADIMKFIDERMKLVETTKMPLI